MCFGSSQILIVTVNCTGCYSGLIIEHHELLLIYLVWFTGAVQVLEVHDFGNVLCFFEHRLRDPGQYDQLIC